MASNRAWKESIALAEIKPKTPNARNLRTLHNAFVLTLELGHIDLNTVLQRVFTNIIDNAIKYSPSHSEITISATETDNEVIIDFQDQGRGIMPEEIPYIFDAF